MSAHEITMYQVKCDCCGEVETEYGDFAAFADFGMSQSYAEGWAVIGDEDFCPSCWCWPEDLPDHPGDDAWTGTDDEVRKHVEHPRADVERRRG